MKTILGLQLSIANPSTTRKMKAYQRLLFAERGFGWIYWNNHMDFMDSIYELPFDDDSKFLH